MKPRALRANPGLPVVIKELRALQSPDKDEARKLMRKIPPPALGKYDRYWLGWNDALDDAIKVLRREYLRGKGGTR